MAFSMACGGASSGSTGTWSLIFRSSRAITSAGSAIATRIAPSSPRSTGTATYRVAISRLISPATDASTRVFVRSAYGTFNCSASVS